jgi:hypothetical protein
VFDSAGRPWLKFGRLMRGHAARLLVNVRNNGVLPVSARLEMERHDAFTVVEGPQVREGGQLCGRGGCFPGPHLAPGTLSDHGHGAATDAVADLAAHFSNVSCCWRCFPRLLDVMCFSSLQAFSVEPKKAATFTVQFAPRTAGLFAHEMALRVKSNPFEQHRLALTGECVQVCGTGAQGRGASDRFLLSSTHWPGGAPVGIIVDAAVILAQPWCHQQAQTCLMYWAQQAACILRTQPWTLSCLEIVTSSGSSRCHRTRLVPPPPGQSQLDPSSQPCPPGPHFRKT